MKLTRDADAFICVMYREYLARRKSGMSIEDSAYFGNDEEIQKTMFHKWLLEDVTHLCWYLESKSILCVDPGDNRANNVSLADDGILYMEERFPEGVSQVLSLLSKLAPLVLPWV